MAMQAAMMIVLMVAQQHLLDELLLLPGLLSFVTYSFSLLKMHQEFIDNAMQKKWFFEMLTFVLFCDVH